MDKVKKLCSALSPALGSPGAAQKNPLNLGLPKFLLKEKKSYVTSLRVFYDLMKGYYSNIGKYFKSIQSNSQLRIPFFAEH